MNLHILSLWSKRLARLALASFRTIINEGWYTFIGKAKYTLQKSRSHSTRAILKISPEIIDQFQIGNLSSEHQPQIDVILVTYNAEAFISDCLRRIQDSAYPSEKISIIVFDNNSSDKSLEILEELKSSLGNLRLIKSLSNLGFGAAVNVAFEETSGKYTLLVNPDTELERYAILNLVRVAMATESQAFGAWEARQQPFEHPKLYDPVTLETEWTSGACILFLNTAFRKAGGFDKNIFLYGEDVDLSWRLRALGYKLRYVPDAVVKHKTYAEPARIKQMQFYNSVVSNGILRFKHGSVWHMLVYVWRIVTVFIVPPRIPKVRRRLLVYLCSSVPKLLKALAGRIATANRIPRDIPRFSGWNYEVRRRGSFYACAGRRLSLPVTIIIRTSQRPHFLREALQSVRNQTYKPHQVVVVEDGAPLADKIIKEYSDLKIDYKATIHKVGRCRAGNIGLSCATGQFINFLDDDDLLFADHCETLIDALETNTTYKAAYSIGFEVKTRIISTQPFVYEEKAYHIVYEQPFDRKLLSKTNFIPINTMMFSRDLFARNGGFDETLDVLEDWDLWQRYCQQTEFLFIEKLTCLYRVPFDSKAKWLRQRQFDQQRQKTTSLMRSRG